MTADMVNHPPHYTFAGPEYEVSRVIQAWRLNFHRGNAVKYIARAGKKGEAISKEIQDLEKAIWYLSDEVRHLKEKQAEELENMKKVYPNHLRDVVENGGHVYIPVYGNNDRTNHDSTAKQVP